MLDLIKLTEIQSCLNAAAQASDLLEKATLDYTAAELSLAAAEDMERAANDAAGVALAALKAAKAALGAKIDAAFPGIKAAVVDAVMAEPPPAAEAAIDIETETETEIEPSS